ncbi:putative glucan endo-1,3-beta-glucosidase eglC [Cytospora mali]|uniref:Probable glucan endo-1,3-beta-glucosidase eglC n=1 Tax=Cytospora mali TaxID=578113 RepID=A0A194VFR7_CYTMA|nr:putative glucan endo-1,3-beta-glucosidase eglC [Valsa mali var. pyri (nom. inval.)]
MKIVHFLLPLIATLVTPTAAFWRGFNVKSNTADGTTCKTKSDWREVFQAIQTFPNGINAARLFYSHKCNSLANAVPEAIATGTHILVGIDDSDSDFEAEKGALLDAINQYGFDWMVGISIGSESLYRGNIGPNSLTNKINDVRAMVENINGYDSNKKFVEIGHVDTTNAWFDEANTDVIRACDFIGVDVYPYFQAEDNNHIDNARVLFDNAITQAKSTVTKALEGSSSGRMPSVWVTETGWPVNGNANGDAVPSVSNAASYFQQVACPSFGKMNTFWFTYQDWFAMPSFAVVNANGQEYFSQKCNSNKRFVQF